MALLGPFNHVSDNRKDAKEKTATRDLKIGGNKPPIFKSRVAVIFNLWCHQYVYIQIFYPLKS